ncbi:hypothetical protein F0562_008667 [Nyssa sinensis]|uniref:25S rRNA (uridine-N(3))-methyltransferase BMT5-like domain-containing protein n=1 Tax=Nyssa sinensis TaxID=561372 RepID=A0A5J5AA58_9ASTE|nr:hypothetical protein F0562_008667 [Nyssa sinensis]
MMTQAQVAHLSVHLVWTYMGTQGTNGALCQNILIFQRGLGSHSDSSTTWALQQEVPTSSPSSDSYDDSSESSPSGAFVCSSSVDLHGDMSTNGALCQNIMVVQQGLDSHSNSSTTWALQQEVPTSSPSSDSYDDSSPSGAFVCSSSVDLHGATSTNGALCQNIMVVQQGLDSHSNSSTTWALQQELLISSPSVESPSDLSTDRSLDLPIVVNSNIEVLEEKRQIIPLLSELNSFKPRGKEKEEEEEERVEEKICKGLGIKERWIKYYSSRQKILLVGEGDFSFSASLALAFGSATNMIATSLNSRGFLLQNYKNALFNIQNLRSRGCKVMHGVDAAEMADHLFFKGKKFNRIVFNFPLAGFFPNESRYSELCRNRNLVFLFLSNAKKMITRRGEIHISHKSNGFFKEWDLENLASSLSVQLIEEVHFNYTDYPGYHTKYGFGGDKNFNCNPSKTYKFGLKKTARNKSLQSSYRIMK